MRGKEMDGLAPGGRVREFVVGCAFGPGIAVEMCLLRRGRGVTGGGGGGRGGLETPPETESEGSGGDGSDGGGSEVGEEAFISEALEGVELD